MTRWFRALHHQFVASALEVKLGHQIDPVYKIGCIIASDAHYLYSCNPINVIAAQKSMRRIWYCGDVQVQGRYTYFADQYLQEKGVRFEDLGLSEEDRKILQEGTVDFFSLSYYTSGCEAVDEQHDATAGNFSLGVANPYLKKSDWDCFFDQQGLRWVLNEIYGRYHVRAMRDALDDGVDLFGYTWWGLTNLISASTGEMKKRYSFIYVDRDNAGKETLK